MPCGGEADEFLGGFEGIAGISLPSAPICYQKLLATDAFLLLAANFVNRRDSKNDIVTGHNINLRSGQFLSH